VRNSEAGFGARHSETAIAMLALAVVARQAGDLALARSTLDRAIETSRELTLRLSDRVEMSRTRAVLSMDLGEYADAQRRLQDLLPQAPSRGERALIWRLLATVHLALGSAAAAEEAAVKAIELAPASPGDPELLFARQAHARALSLKGLAVDAGDELHAVIQGLRDAGYPGPSMEVLRARRMHAETLARAGRLGDSLAELRAVAGEQSAVQATQEIEYAQTLDLTGCVLRDLGQVDEALASHRQAAALLEKKLPPDHPWRQRNTLYQEAVAANVHATPEAAADWTRHAAAYASRFPSDSQWRTLLDAHGSHPHCTAAGGAACGLYL